MILRLIVLSLLSLVTACGQKQEPSQQGREAAPPEFSKLVWNAPEDWIEEEPSSGMRLTQYRLEKVEGDAEDAVCYVSHFAGGGGSVEANLHRWYEQFTQSDGRPSEAAAKVNKAEHHGLQQTTVDVSGTFQQSTTPMGPMGEDKPGYRMLGAVVETSADLWFVKLIGPERTVARWEKSFYEFMQTFRPDTGPEAGR